MDYQLDLKLDDNSFTEYVKIDHLPSKGEDDKWLPLNTIIMVRPNEDHKDLFNTIAAFYAAGTEAFKLVDNIEQLMIKMEKLAPNLGIAKLHNQNSEWTLKGMWPASIDFGELCYSSDPNVEIGINWRFIHAERVK